MRSLTDTGFGDGLDWAEAEVLTTTGVRLQVEKEGR
jgi:hypothetical protein